MNSKPGIQNSNISQFLLLLMWIAVGIGLRFTNLTAKSPWTDEFSTLVFSLGNSFRSVPLNQAISPDILLQPLHLNPTAGIADVIHHLREESNHPPLYFVLAHWWIQLFITPLAPFVNEMGESRLFWVARSLPALFGVASIPTVYGLSRIAFRSPLVAQLAAAMMAVSPYGIFLAQEARHYTLAILWVIASLCCLMVAARNISYFQSLPLWVLLTWIIINILGISTHYFFTLTLGAEAIVLLALIWNQGIKNHDKRSTEQEGLKYRRFLVFPIPSFSSIVPLIVVAASVLVGGLLWIPAWLNNYNRELTQWIYTSERVDWTWFSPLFETIASGMSMLFLMPVEVSHVTIVIASIVITEIFFLWLLPLLYQGLKIQLKQNFDTHLSIHLLGGVVASAIMIFLFFTYTLGINLTWQARYHFVYFPAVIVLVGASLVSYWTTDANAELTSVFSPYESQAYPSFFSFLISSGKRSIVLIWLMGFLSGIVVIFNLGYQKYYRPDLFWHLRPPASQVSILIATTHKTHIETGEMMGIAWELKRSSSSVNCWFLLVHQDKDSETPSTVLKYTLNSMPHPIDLWVVNFHASLALNNCVTDSLSLPKVQGYDYKLYHCP